MTFAGTPFSRLDASAANVGQRIDNRNCGASQLGDRFTGMAAPGRVAERTFHQLIPGRASRENAAPIICAGPAPPAMVAPRPSPRGRERGTHQPRRGVSSASLCRNTARRRSSERAPLEFTPGGAFTRDAFVRRVGMLRLQNFAENLRAPMLSTSGGHALLPRIQPLLYDRRGRSAQRQLVRDHGVRSVATGASPAPGRNPELSVIVVNVPGQSTWQLLRQFPSRSLLAPSTTSRSKESRNLHDVRGIL